MAIVLVSIGDEVLYGFTQNLNAFFISKELVRHNLFISEQVTIGDDPAKIKNVIRFYLELGYTVITTGGLGPTCDDHTRLVAAALFSRQLIRYQACETFLKAKYGEGLPTLEDQSIWPEGADLFENRNGTAFGFSLQDPDRYPGSILYCLPGPPIEMRPILETRIIPQLKNFAQHEEAKESISSLHMVGIYEHQVDPYLRTIEKKYPKLQFGIYPSYGTLSVHVRAKTLYQGDIDNAFEDIKSQFKEYIFNGTHGAIEEALIDLCAQNRWTLSCAESCTGGALSARLTALPGVSKVFLGATVSYSNSAKNDLLEVSEKILNQYGAVSEEVVHEMANGAKKSYKSDIAIAVSGIFGPEGAMPNKPVGTVSYAIIAFDKSFVGTRQFQGDRLAIREKVVQFLLIECFKLLSMIQAK